MRKEKFIKKILLIRKTVIESETPSESSLCQYIRRNLGSGAVEHFKSKMESLYFPREAYIHERIYKDLGRDYIQGDLLTISKIARVMCLSEWEKIVLTENEYLNFEEWVDGERRVYTDSACNRATCDK